jgi:hypothetical protein
MRKLMKMKMRTMKKKKRRRRRRCLRRKPKRRKKSRGKRGDDVSFNSKLYDEFEVKSNTKSQI